jgi:dethiobiotin synthetase
LNTLFIAGTEAQVGKTVVLSALVAYWQRYTGQRVGVMKPVDCQIDAQLDTQPQSGLDADFLRQQFDLNQTSDQITPVLLTESLPSASGKAQGKSSQIELDLLWRQFQTLQQQRDLVLLEGWGGLGSPLSFETTVADLAWDWRLPTVLVVPVQPGAVAQAVANVALAQQSRVHLKGIILNEVRPCSPQQRADWIEIGLLQSLTRKPVLGYIPHLANPQAHDSLIQAAANLELEGLLPGLETAFSIQS